MSTEIFWSVLGVSVSTIFGIVGVYLAIRSRHSGAITFVNEQTIELFDAIGNSIDGLAVTYGNSDVKDNLVLLNGAFINSGRFDIGKSMVEKPITISLPEDFEWLGGKIVSSKVSAELRFLNENTLEIETGLFRRGECVRFHALAQLPDNEDGATNSEILNRSFNFSHRILNTKNINETELVSEKSSKKSLKRRALPLFIMLIILASATGVLTYIGYPKVVIYPYQTDDTHIESVRIKVKSNDDIKISSVSSNFEHTENFSKFIAKVNGDPSLSKAPLDLFLLFMLGSQFLIIIIPLCLLFYSYYKNRKLIHIIEEKN